MDRLSELTDFSAYDGVFPCVLCQADSSKTVLGGHWKCSGCAHVFNKDGSEMEVQCHCEACYEKNKKPELSLVEAIKHLAKLEKKQQQKTKKKLKGKKTR
jgi:hypothetical protein